MLGAPPLLTLSHLRKTYQLRGTAADRLFRRRAEITAVADLSLIIEQGDVLGVVGESGSGKSTLGRMIVRLTPPTAGAIIHRGTDLSGLSGRALRPYRRVAQMIFQDTQSSLNPRKRVGRALREALAARGVRRADRVAEAARLLDLVGLDPALAARHPHELSGGQRQRVGIARSLCMEPELIVADEPVSALDVSLQGQILNLLVRLRQDFGLTMIFISHDLAVVRRICGRVAVMYAGHVVETGPPDQLIANPAHPYTRLLIESVPKGLAERARHRKSSPAPASQEIPKTGCAFHPRCPLVEPVCLRIVPKLSSISPRREIACHVVSGVSI